MGSKCHSKKNKQKISRKPAHFSIYGIITIAASAWSRLGFSLNELCVQENIDYVERKSKCISN